MNRNVVCCLGGPLVNKIGIKWALVLGSISFPIQGSAYYCNSKFGNEWVSDEHPLLSCSEIEYLHLIFDTAVSDPKWCYQWHWDCLLVCCRSRCYYDPCAFWRSWKVPCSMDCLPKSWTVGWWCNQVSRAPRLQEISTDNPVCVAFLKITRKVSAAG